MIDKISIIGAGGVGSVCAFSVLQRIAFRELSLFDVRAGLAKGVALDLEDTRGILHFSTKISGGDSKTLIAGASVVVVTAGLPRKKGMSRLDLLKTNSGIVREVCRNIKRCAPDSIVIIVTNPLDVMTWVAVKETGFSRKRVLGMGASLDTSRLCALVNGITGISSKSVEGFILGQHSQDMMVSFDRIKIAGKPVQSVLSKSAALRLRDRIRLRGAEIVGHLGDRSAVFAPGLAVCRILEAIAADANELLPVSVLLKGEYGLRNVCAGVPCLINRNGVDRVVEFSLSREEKKEFQKITAVFRNARKEL